MTPIVSIYTPRDFEVDNVEQGADKVEVTPTLTGPAAMALVAHIIVETDADRTRYDLKFGGKNASLRLEKVKSFPKGKAAEGAEA